MPRKGGKQERDEAMITSYAVKVSWCDYSGHTDYSRRDYASYESESPEYIWAHGHTLREAVWDLGIELGERGLPCDEPTQEIISQVIRDIHLANIEYETEPCIGCDDIACEFGFCIQLEYREDSI